MVISVFVFSHKKAININYIKQLIDMAQGKIL